MYQHLDKLLNKYEELHSLKNDIIIAFNILKNSFKNDGKLLVCGNGGSSADADHICGELVKGFNKKRKYTAIKKSITSYTDEDFYDNLQMGLPALSLTSHDSLISAWNNDCNPAYIFAQQVGVYGNPKKDVLLGLSTSGNSENVLNAFKLCKAKKMETILLTGHDGGKIKEFADCTIIVPSNITPDIQELHLPIYHALCAELEEYFFPGD